MWFKKSKPINEYIEYTNLGFSIKSKSVKQFVSRAIRRKYRSVVMTYNNISLAKQVITNAKADTKIVTVFGFPTDKYNPNIITPEYGVYYDELDVVLPVTEYYHSYPPYLVRIAGFLDAVKRNTTSTTKEGNKIIVKSKPVKLIIETMLMRAKKMQIKELCKIARDAKIDIIKTNTGLIKRKDFNSLLEDVKLIRKYWKGPIKAAGGITTIAQVQQLIDLGVDYIGTSTDLLTEGEENE